jgi:hypothetical protein
MQMAVKPLAWRKMSSGTPEKPVATYEHVIHTYIVQELKYCNGCYYLSLVAFFAESLADAAVEMAAGVDDEEFFAHGG